MRGIIHAKGDYFMKKSYMIILSITVVTVLLTLLFTFNKNYSTSSTSKEKIETKEVNTLEENNKELETENTDESKEEKELENNVEKNIVTNNIENTSTPKQTEKPKEQSVKPKETKQEEKTKETITNVQEPIPVKEPTEWEKFGITEDEYYNKPMWKWATLDFSVDELGSKENALKACDILGRKILNPCLDDNGRHIPNCDLETKDGSFTCYELTSYSGRFLGYYLKVTELTE